MPWLTQLRIEAGLEFAGPFGRKFTKTAFLRGSSEVLRDAASSEGVLCVAVATCNCTVAWTRHYFRPCKLLQARMWIKHKPRRDFLMGCECGLPQWIQAQILRYP